MPSLRSATHAAIRAGWARQLDVPVSLPSEPGVHVEARDGGRGIVVLELGEVVVVVAPPQAAERLRVLDRERLVDIDEVVAAVGDPSARPIGTATLSFADRGSSVAHPREEPENRERCDPEVVQSLYDAVGGAPALRALAQAWHSRVLADEIVSHAFRHGAHPQHTERLAAYWAEALGGPATYSEQYGDESSVVRRHSGNGRHEEMDRRAIACFDAALADVGVTDERLRQTLHDYFAWATTTTMARYHESADDVPDGLRIPRWSWNGPQA